MGRKDMWVWYMKWSRCSFILEIREVSSEMPMYLLAEDEGNEEEILRLLESHPSPSLISLPSTSESMFLSSRESGQDTVRTRELGASGTDILQSGIGRIKME